MNCQFSAFFAFLALRSAGLVHVCLCLIEMSNKQNIKIINMPETQCFQNIYIIFHYILEMFYKSLLSCLLDMTICKQFLEPCTSWSLLYIYVSVNVRVHWFLRGSYFRYSSVLLFSKCLIMVNANVSENIRENFIFVHHNSREIRKNKTNAKILFPCIITLAKLRENFISVHHYSREIKRKKNERENFQIYSVLVPLTIYEKRCIRLLWSFLMLFFKFIFYSSTGIWQFLLPEYIYKDQRCGSPEACTEVITTQDAFDFMYNK